MKNLIILILAVSLTQCRIRFIGEFHQASEPKRATASLPEKTFETFWQTFEDNYAFFELRKVDWHESYKNFRPKVTAATTDDSLFHILSEMVRPLQDEHVNIVYPRKKSYQEFTSSKPSRFLNEFPDNAARQKFWAMVDHTLTKNGFHSLWAEGPKEDDVPLFVYSRSPDTGYIRFTRCYSTSKTEDEHAKDALLADQALARVLEKLRDTRQIIIDVRINEGGNDEFSYAVANHFSTTRHIGHYKQFRIGGYNDFSPLQPIYIEPQQKAYTNPVKVLTNDQSASAADVFAMIMRTLPNVTLLGERTNGIYSDMYGFTLPNGWYASLSNERYFSGDMKCYEGIGTPVDVEILNTQQDLVTGVDPVLTRALAEK